ncbi:unnamed protein product [Aphanomyces euteiches]|uniref:DJ-1/PfpI domain-containing protein n=1 Tax=Aphanomyces euteiches TaxID=100861 RepID=A0A6G0W2D9_9STRA|nr:hypothetical protein Ae201684_019261 [Aphanomyces euteiches]KAF0731440.1 hypothetical protein Ae201684_011341 [Aphanomyces euteiches]KAF0731451.1 hypothetical protein Ae201684_011352 [Aphanomyces euteiches]KAH9100495.1 hypothetical protein Ae201684P_006692 [Aphanomyces euteiches]KAH9100842.1 hypothetical protein Ae201684P_007034 [Aphanomyces euteiches]
MKTLQLCFALLIALDAFVSAASVSHLDIGVVMFNKTENLDSVGPTSYLELVGLGNVSVTFETISFRPGRIQATNLQPLYASTSYETAKTKWDVFLIPGGPGTDDVLADPSFMKYINKAVKESTYVLSVCNGADILAATGALNGRNATTNKLLFKGIAARHPVVHWVRHARWVVDGKYWTSSGVSAGQDLGHAFVKMLLGDAVAKRISEILEHSAISDPSNDPFKYLIDA